MPRSLREYLERISNRNTHNEESNPPHTVNTTINWSDWQPVVGNTTQWFPDNDNGETTRQMLENAYRNYYRNHSNIVAQEAMEIASDPVVHTAINTGGLPIDGYAVHTDEMHWNYNWMPTANTDNIYNNITARDYFEIAESPERAYRTIGLMPEIARNDLAYKPKWTDLYSTSWGKTYHRSWQKIVYKHGKLKVIKRICKI